MISCQFLKYVLAMVVKSSLFKAVVIALFTTFPELSVDCYFLTTFVTKRVLVQLWSYTLTM